MQPPVRHAAEHAIARKRRVLDHLAAARRDWNARTIRIPVDTGRQVTGLPEGVELRPGELRVHFDKPIELLQKLFALSQTLAKDFDSLVEQMQVS